MILNPNLIDNGIDTSDATATASDIASAKTAYVNDGKVTGTIEVPTSKTLSAGSRSLANSKIKLSKTVDSDFIMRSGNTVSIEDSASNFGDATASDVKSGKTFTSSSGLKVSGTYSQPTVVAETFNLGYGASVIYFSLTRVTGVYGGLRSDGGIGTTVNLSISGSILWGISGNQGIIFNPRGSNSTYMAGVNLTFSGNSAKCTLYNSIYSMPNSGFRMYGAVVNDSNASAIYTR